MEAKSLGSTVCIHNSVGVHFTGIIPWNAFPGKICGSALENICNTNEVNKSQSWSLTLGDLQPKLRNRALDDGQSARKGRSFV